MKRVPRSIVVIATVVGIVTTVALLQLRPYLAYRRIVWDVKWNETASPDEQRRTAHQALGLWLVDPHDIFITLDRYGDESSIPYLRNALSHAPKPDDEGMPCTWVHGQEALARILGRGHPPTKNSR